MKTNAIIYTRVSTDDQADRGYSLAYQEERLRKYCEMNELNVIAHYQEDHSAKNFNRPAFSKLLSFVKKNKGKVQHLLFLNWSRFSRNTKLTYVMMDEFNELSIELQAIDQPLDLSVPENKMMLAFYIASNEVENDRRSLNVLMGMYRARKEGRWTTVAPTGYENVREPDGKALIIPDKNADLVREAFAEFAKGTYGIEELRLKMYRKGLKVGRARFPMLLRNRVYSGKVFVPAYKGDAAHYVSGIHEPLITEELFEQVQNILKGRAPNRPTKNTVREEFPLRGFLKCRQCGKNISASASKGNGGKYFYYHCTCGCPERFKAIEANEQFVNLLNEIEIIPEALKLFREFLSVKFNNDQRNEQLESRKTDEGIKRNNDRIQNAQQLMLDNKITSDEYREIKTKYEELNADLIKQKESISGEEEYTQFLNSGVMLLKELGEYYDNADLATRQIIIDLLFSGKLVYADKKFNTESVSEALTLISGKSTL